VDGPENTVYEVDLERRPAGAANPYGNAFAPVARPLVSEAAAQRTVDVAAGRTWKVVNHRVTNRLGRPVAYQLVPGPAPTLLAQHDSAVAKRAGFATRNLWVTAFHAEEARAAGPYPNQHPGGAGLPEWTAADRPLEDTDVVLWFTFGSNHISRPEDWPVMPVEYAGFTLRPVGFFDRNPALDVPPTQPADAAACH
jgi:primary-amine oxidase